MVHLEEIIEDINEVCNQDEESWNVGMHALFVTFRFKAHSILREY